VGFYGQLFTCLKDVGPTQGWPWGLCSSAQASGWPCGVFSCLEVLSFIAQCAFIGSCLPIKDVCPTEGCPRGLCSNLQASGWPYGVLNCLQVLPLISSKKQSQEMKFAIFLIQQVLVESLLQKCLGCILLLIWNEI